MYTECIGAGKANRQAKLHSLGKNSQLFSSRIQNRRANLTSCLEPAESAHRFGKQRRSFPFSLTAHAVSIFLMFLRKWLNVFGFQLNFELKIRWSVKRHANCYESDAPTFRKICRSGSLENSRKTCPTVFTFPLKAPMSSQRGWT